MDIMTHAKFQFSQLMVILIFGIRASEPPWAWRTTQKARPDKVKVIRNALSHFKYALQLMPSVGLSIQRYI